MPKRCYSVCIRTISILPCDAEGLSGWARLNAFLFVERKKDSFLSGIRE